MSQNYKCILSNYFTYNYLHSHTVNSKCKQIFGQYMDYFLDSLQYIKKQL